MTSLIIKEEIGFELLKEGALSKASQEHRLIDFNVPIHQGPDGAFVGRRAASGN